MTRRLILALCLVAIIGAGSWFAWEVRPTQVRERLLDSLNARFDGRAEATSVQVSVYPQPTLSGTGLTIRLRELPDVPPLISIDSFEASAPLLGLVGRQFHLSTVKVDTTNIYLPPGGLRPAVQSLDLTARAPRGDRSPILIDEIVSRNARLEIATRKPDKLPHVFEIHDVVMLGFGLPEGSRFHAGVTNAIPRGLVETSGTFGPWRTEAPSLTPISGEYAFKKANLDDIPGISGILSSVGRYRGTLERIEVDGQTETPDFSIDLAGQPVPLSTKFKAIVDGTNGDTWLDSVEARLAESTILASGAVIRDRDIKGRRVAMDIRIKDARIEDLLRLAVKAAKAPLTGRMQMTTTFLLPAGEEDVIERLTLNGQFSLAQARFTNIDVQRKIVTLSLRARGREKADPAAPGSSVVSNLKGRFVMRDAVLDLQQLTFSVPGAEVQLAGTFNLRDEMLDFKGDLLVDATLADMTSGFKSFLARLAQPFFRRPGGGSRVPIKISGPRSNPEFGLDVRRVFKRG